MKECKYCGTTYDEAVREACPNCGGTAVVTEKEKVQAEEQEIYEQIIYTDSNKRLRNLILAGASAVVVIILIIVITTMTNNSKTYTYPGAFGVSQEITVKEIKETIELGDSYIKQGEYLKALDTYKKVPNEYDKYDKVRLKIDSAVDGYSTEIISRVEGLLKDENYAAAISVLDKATSIVGNNNVFTLKKEAVLGHYETEFLDNATSYVDAGEYKNALDILDLAIEIIENSATLLQKKEEILSLYKFEFLERASHHSDESQYTEALAILTTAQGIFGLSDSDVTAKTIEVHKAKVTEKISEYEQTNDYATAIQYIEQELSNVNNDTQVVEKLNAYKVIYKEKVLDDVAEAFENSGYEAAISILNRAKTILNDSSVEKTITEYKEYAPQSPFDIDYYTANNEHYLSAVGTVSDNYNVDHSNAYSAWTTKDILLNGQYERLTGTLFKVYEMRGDSSTPLIKIYCDDVLVVDEKIEIAEHPVSFSIDLTGVNVVKFTIDTTMFSMGSHFKHHTGAISDFNIYKKWVN